MTKTETIAAAIANARGMRRGAAPISNILELLTPRLRDDVMDDAVAVEKELSQLVAAEPPNVMLIRRLVDGIKWWADQEDGVPDDVWDAYADAVEFTTGKRPAPKD